MGEVIQGPWKKKTPAQAVENELRTIARALAGEPDAANVMLIEPSRWPSPRAVLPSLPASDRKPQR